MGSIEHCSRINISDPEKVATQSLSTCQNRKRPFPEEVRQEEAKKVQKADSQNTQKQETEPFFIESNGPEANNVGEYKPVLHKGSTMRPDG